MARALNDAKLQEQMTSPSDDAWRYRETDLWRELLQRTEALQVALRAGPGAPGVTGAVVEPILVDDAATPVNPQ
jgi:hypothetical protein